MSTMTALQHVSCVLDLLASAQAHIEDIRFSALNGEIDDHDLRDLDALERRLNEARRIGRRLARVLNNRSRKTKR